MPLGFDGFQEVKYGDTVLPMAHKMTFASSAEYDSTGNILQGYRLTFRGSCYVVQTTTDSLMNHVSAIQTALMIPRQEFSWTFNGAPVYIIPPAQVDGIGDRRWGPKPRVLSINPITGGRAVKIDFEIEAFVAECPFTSLADGFNQPSDIEEASWSFDYGFDANMNCTRTITGSYRVRSPYAASDLLVDGSFWPALPANFKRQSMSHKTSPDGSTISFSVTDVQRWRTLPRPLTDGDCTFRLTQTQGMPVIRKALAGWFSAPNDVNKRVIMQFIVALIRQRFPLAFNPITIDSNGLPTAEYITNFSITDHPFENRIDFQVESNAPGVSAFKSPGGTQASVSFAALADLGWLDIAGVVPGPTDAFHQIDGYSEQRPMLGTAGLIPVPLQPWSMCSGPGIGPTDTLANYASSPGITGGPTASGSGYPGTIGGDTPSDGSISPGTLNDNPLSADHLLALYTSFEETWTFILDRHIAMIPIPVSNADNLTMQTAQPELRILQIGHATRIGAMPVIPAPAYIGTSVGDPADARVVRNWHRTHNPRLIGDGVTLEYRTEWNYEIIAPAAHSLSDSDKVGVLVPQSPVFNSDFNAENTGAMPFAGVQPSQDGTYENDNYEL